MKSEIDNLINERDSARASDAAQLKRTVQMQAERDTLKSQRDALEIGLKSCLEWMEFTIPCLHATCPHCHDRVNVGGLNWGGPINKARTALALCAKDSPVKGAD